MSKDSKKTTLISFRATQEEKRFLDTFARTEKMSPSEIMRVAINLLKNRALDIKSPQGEGTGRDFLDVIWDCSEKINKLKRQLTEAALVASEALNYIVDGKKPISEEDFEKLRQKGDYEWLFEIAQSETDDYFNSKGHIVNPLHRAGISGWSAIWNGYILEDDFIIYQKIKNTMLYDDFRKHLAQKISPLTGVDDELYAATVKEMIDRLKDNCKTRISPRCKNIDDPINAWRPYRGTLEEWRSYIEKFNMADDLVLEIDFFSYFEFEEKYCKDHPCRNERVYEILPMTEAEEVIKQRDEIIKSLEAVKSFQDTDFQGGAK